MVYNKASQVILAKDVEITFSFWQRLWGMIGKRKLPDGYGLLLKPCNAIHSFFMSFPFDAVFLNNDLVIVYIIESMPPFRFSHFVRTACSVLELPDGTVRYTGCKVGDCLALRQPLI